MLMAKSGSSTVQYSLKQQQQEQQNNNKSYKKLPFWDCAWHWDDTTVWYNSSIQHRPSLKLDLTMHILGLRLRLGQSCVELHYGIVLMGKFCPTIRRRLVIASKRSDTVSKAVLSCNSLQHRPILTLDLKMVIPRLRLRLGRCCVESHYGTVLIAKFCPSFWGNLVT